MTENAAAPDADVAPAPVRVPNVSPGARSGLDHTIIGSAAQEAYDATYADDAGIDPVTAEVPEDSDDLYEWIILSGDETERERRVRAALEVEEGKSPDDQRPDVLDGLRAALAPSDEPNDAAGPVIPEDATSVEKLIAWVTEVEGDERTARARAVLDAEYEKAPDDQRSTLVGPLEAFVPAPDEQGTAPTHSES